jgi:hypothetical protein
MTTSGELNSLDSNRKRPLKMPRLMSALPLFAYGPLNARSGEAFFARLCDISPSHVWRSNHQAPDKPRCEYHRPEVLLSQDIAPLLCR